MQRVKVYRLNEDGTWDDKGTGRAAIDYLDQYKSPGLVVTAEDDARPLLHHKVRSDLHYKRQSDNTIISWSDPELGTELALSFQEAVGCNTIFSEIAALQSEGGGSPGNFRRRMVDEFESAGHGDSGGDFSETGAVIPVELPSPTLGNLEEMARILSEVTPYQRERLAAQVHAMSYIPKIVDLFRQCEDLEDREGLANLYKIVRGLMMLTDSGLLEELLKEEHVLDIVGALEYDPDIPVHMNHREFLRDKVAFKEVVPITNPAIKAKIHQTYRIQYVKDVILPKILDDQVFSTLGSLILLNNMDVILSLDQDPNFLPELFHRLKTVSPMDPAWHDLVAFLQEFCSLMKQMQLSNRRDLFSKLVGLGIYDVLTQVMKESKVSVRLRATDIMYSSLHHDGSSLRTFLINQEGHELLGLLVKDLIEGGGCGLSEQIVEVLRALLDPETMDNNQDRAFMEIFYEKCMLKLVDALANDRGEGAGCKHPSVSPSAKGAILELMSFCVQHHGYNVKYFFLRNNVLDKLVNLLRTREKWLVVAYIRFLRTCVSTKDEFYNRHFMRNNLFEPVIDLFLENGQRYNLLNSTVIELVEFIRKSNIKALVTHMVDKFYHRLKDITYVDIFKKLKLEYDKSQERGASLHSGSYQDGFGQGADRRRRDAREMEKEEEDYFRDMDDESDPGSSSQSMPPKQGPMPQNGRVEPPGIVSSSPDSGAGPTSSSSDGSGGHVLGGLVDYDDDDDDMESNSPPHKLQSNIKRNLDQRARLPVSKRPKKEVKCG